MGQLGCGGSSDTTAEQYSGLLSGWCFAVARNDRLGDSLIGRIGLTRLIATYQTDRSGLLRRRSQ